MKIVFTSRYYLPYMGGTVTVLTRWTQALIQMGHDVVILTKTAGDGLSNIEEWRNHPPQNPQVCRFHSFIDSVEVIRNADRVIIIEMSLYWQMVIFAAGKWPLATHHTHLVPVGDKMRVYRWLQYFAGFLIPSVACSRMIAKQWGPHVGVIPNPYDESTFRFLGLEKDIDFLFAGRFANEKGLGIFIGAIQKMSAQFLAIHTRLPRVAFAGTGPDLILITKLQEEEIPSCVISYLGEASASELSTLYNRTSNVVIPSIWQEPFGLIAIEALACGCQVICSDQPGLRESTGGHAIYCETGNIESFSLAMAKASCEPNTEPVDQQKLKDHLDQHKLRHSAELLLIASRTYNNRKFLNSK